MLRVGLSTCRFSFALLLVMFSFFAVKAQDLAFRHYSVTDGVASATVYSCMQDKKGYLWFGTEAGVNRFNGRKFERFSVDHGLADSEIFKIFEDSYNRIWFLSFNGHLSYYLDGKFYNEGNAPFLRKAYCGQSMMGMVEDGKKRLWVFSNGNFLIKIDKDEITQYDFKYPCYQSGGVNINLLKDGSPEFRYGYKIFHFNEERQEMEFVKNGFYRYTIPRITITESENQCRIVSDGVIRITGESTQLLVKNPRADRLLYFTSVYEEKNGLCWVGTLESGVRLFKTEGDSFKLIKTLLPEIQVSDIAKDHEGNMWFCTKDDGLFMLPSYGRNTVVYPKSDNFPTSNIYAVYCDSKGIIWTGGDRGIVTCIDSTGAIIKNFRLAQLDKNNYRINSITEDRDSNIWFVTSMHVHKIDKNGVEKIVYSSKNKRSLAGKAITVSDSNEVYLAYFQGILKYNKVTEALDILPHQNLPTRTYSIHAHGRRLFVSNL